MNFSHPSRHEAFVEIFGTQPNHPHHPAPPSHLNSNLPSHSYSHSRSRSHSFPGTDQGAYDKAALLILLRDARHFSGRGGRGRFDGGGRGHPDMRGGFGGHRHAHSQHHFEIPPPPLSPHFNTSDDEHAHGHHRGPRGHGHGHEHGHRDSPRPGPDDRPPAFPQSGSHPESNERGHGLYHGPHGPRPPLPHTPHHHHHHGHPKKRQGPPHHGLRVRGKKEAEPDWNIVDSSGPSDSENESDVLLSGSPTISNASVDVRVADAMEQEKPPKKGAEDVCELHPIVERLARMMQSRGDQRGRQYHGSPPRHGHADLHGRGNGNGHGHGHIHSHAFGQAPLHHGDKHPQHGHHHNHRPADARGSGRHRSQNSPPYTYGPRHSRGNVPFPSSRGPPPFFPMQGDDVFSGPHHFHEHTSLSSCPLCILLRKSYSHLD